MGQPNPWTTLLGVNGLTSSVQFVRCERGFSSYSDDMCDIRDAFLLLSAHLLPKSVGPY